MTGILQDVRYGVRAMLKSPGFAIVAILALALGIGANTAIFSVVYGVLLRPMPYRDSNRLVVMWERAPQMDLSVAYPDFEDWRTRSKSFESMAAYRRDSFNLSGTGEPERLQGRMVSWSFMQTFATKVELGRDFTPADDRSGAAPTAILMHGFWERRFGGDPNIVGQQITLNDQKVTVIGVAPASFKYGEGIDLLSPIELARTKFWTRGDHPGIYVVGRLKPGVTLTQARAEMEMIARAINAENSQDGPRDVMVRVQPMLENFVEDVQTPLWIMLAAVGFMLLIACSNVANILLARATGRQRELAIRSAIGATRRRMLQQLLTESVLLSAIGGALGVVLAVWAIDLLRAARPASLPRIDEIGLHPMVLVFTAAVSLATGILFGLFPAWHASKASVNDLLKEATSRTSSYGHQRFRQGLVSAEFALALMLLITAALNLKSLANLLRVDPGFDPRNMLTFQVSLTPKDDSPAALNTLERMKQEIAAAAGVESVAYSNGAPMIFGAETSFFAESADIRDPNAEHMTVEYLSSPEYLSATHIQLVRGRFISSADRLDTPRVIVIDTNLARDIFGDADPVGKRLKLGDPNKPQLFEIVGVVGHVKQYGIGTAGPVHNEAYFALAQTPPESIPVVMRRITFLVRSSGDPRAIIDAVRAAIRRVAPDQPIYDVNTYRSVIDDYTEPQRFTTALLTTFAAVALLLAAIGIYGVISYSVTQRTREFGIRIALGARTADVLTMVFRNSSRALAVGLALGLLFSFLAGRYLRAILFGVSSADPLIFTLVPLILLSVALIATYIPARRATRVDPLEALRYE